MLHCGELIFPITAYEEMTMELKCLKCGHELTALDPLTEDYQHIRCKNQSCKARHTYYDQEIWLTPKWWTNPFIFFGGAILLVIICSGSVQLFFSYLRSR
jgi:hypothetical protein